MGRIQRKKPTTAKKKKTDAETKSAFGNQAATEIGAKKAATGDMPAQVKKKKIGLPAKKQATAASPATIRHKDNIFGKAAQFLREVKVELKKVAWPSRKQTIGSTVVVIALVMIISIFLGAVDLGLAKLIRVVLQ